MDSSKEKYYNLTKNTKPHLNVLKFLELNLPPQNAIDLGCGAGRDTIALLKNNWNVLSIDKENTEDIIKEQLTDKEQERFKFLNTLFGNAILPKTNLVIANFCLPFSKKEHFRAIWNKIDNAILKDRIFCW